MPTNKYAARLQGLIKAQDERDEAARAMEAAREEQKRIAEANKALRIKKWENDVPRIRDIVSALESDLKGRIVGLTTTEIVMPGTTNVRTLLVKCVPLNNKKSRSLEFEMNVNSNSLLVKYDGQQIKEPNLSETDEEFYEKMIFHLVQDTISLPF